MVWIIICLQLRFTNNMRRYSCERMLLVLCVRVCVCVDGIAVHFTILIGFHNFRWVLRQIWSNNRQIIHFSVTFLQHWQNIDYMPFLIYKTHCTAVGCPEYNMELPGQENDWLSKRHFGWNNCDTNLRESNAFFAMPKYDTNSRLLAHWLHVQRASFIVWAICWIAKFSCHICHVVLTLRSHWLHASRDDMHHIGTFGLRFAAIFTSLELYFNLITTVNSHTVCSVASFSSPCCILNISVCSIRHDHWLYLYVCGTLLWNKLHATKNVRMNATQHNTTKRMAL